MGLNYKQMNKFFSREVRVGLMAIVAMFLLYLGLHFLKGIDIFSPVNSYYARYENLGGLVPSSPVYIKGYKVGQVESVTYDFTKQRPFVVKISVAKDIHLPKDTRVELFDEGLMGGKAVQLVFAPIKENQFFAANDTIESRVAIGLMASVSDKLLPKIESVVTQADSLVRSVRKLAENKSIDKSLSSFEQTTSDLAATSSKLKSIMGNDVTKVIGDVNVVTTDLRQVSGNLKKVDFNNTFVSLNHSMENLNKFTEKLNGNDGTLGLLLTNKDLYQNLNKTVSSADNLLNDIKLNPKRYVNISVFGKGDKK
jgi:phospholipid/cholesterol/gamma-HCH transport system substrate-binding protein